MAVLVIESGSTEAYDAFNYNISGTAPEKRVLSWNPDEVVLSPWSLADLPVDGSATPTSGSVTLNLGGVYENGDEKPTSYLLQFYKVTKDADPSSIELK